MPPPQGIFDWPGMLTFISGQFTFTHGVEPCLCQIRIAPQLTPLASDGTLTLFFGGSIQEFPDCKLELITVEYDKEGKQVWTLHILDRRWKWQETGYVEGNFNIKLDKAGNTIWEPSRRQPQDLARQCLDAMGEPVYDVNQIPNEDYPETEWNVTLGAKALLDLVDPLGCRVVLRQDNSVQIASAGDGLFLPTGQFISGSADLNPPNYPAAIRVKLAPTIVQSDFVLRAVGLERDGSIKPIDELSYKPPNGWENTSVPGIWPQVADPADRKLAQKYVWKLFQIDPTQSISFPGIDPFNPANETIEDLQRLIFLDEQLTQSPATELDPEKPLPAWVYGVYWGKSSTSSNAIQTVDPTIDEADVKKGYYDGSWTFNKDKRLILFADVVYQSLNNRAASPDLRLRTSCKVRDAETFAPIRYSKVLPVPLATTITEEKVVKKDDIGLQKTYSASSVGGSFTNSNQAKADEALDYYLAGELKKYQLEDPATFTYPGFRFDIQLDGAIQQIQWIVDGEGFATTVASRNREDPTQTLTYLEQKRNALIKATLANAAETSRTKVNDRDAQSDKGKPI